MSARFRRRGEIVEACQFTGENEEECRTVARFRHEVFTDLMSPGYWVWVDSAGCIHADSDERFRSSFEPVPLPEPAPADGWVRVEDGLPRGYGWFLTASLGGYLEITFFDDHQMWQRVHAVTHWRPLPAPPVVEGGK